MPAVFSVIVGAGFSSGGDAKANEVTFSNSSRKSERGSFSIFDASKRKEGFTTKGSLGGGKSCWYTESRFRGRHLRKGMAFRLTLGILDAVRLQDRESS